MKKRTKLQWQDLNYCLSGQIQRILAGLGADEALPSIDPWERFEACIPKSDEARRILDQASEAFLIGQCVRSFPSDTRWQLLWRLQAAQHIFRWYGKNPRGKNDGLASFYDTLNDQQLMRTVILDSSCQFFATLGAAATHLLEDITWYPDLAES